MDKIFFLSIYLGLWFFFVSAQLNKKTMDFNKVNFI